MFSSPLDQELFKTLLDEIAELLYVEDCQLEKPKPSSTDLSFENHDFEAEEII